MKDVISSVIQLSGNVLMWYYRYNTLDCDNASIMKHKTQTDRQTLNKDLFYKIVRVLGLFYFP